MTHPNAWRGEIGRQDRDGIGALRAHRTRGGLTPGPVADVWRISDLGKLGGGEIPGRIVDRLRDLAESRKRDTGNGCPSDGDWSPQSSPVPLALGDWSGQVWHTVTLDNLDAPAGSARPRPRGYRTNGAVPTIPPAGMAELLTDLRWSREVAAGNIGRRARMAARRQAFAAG
jgi:hypothetical protein